MIDSLSYIYLAMYALDLYDGLHGMIIALFVGSIISWFVSWLIPLIGMACAERESELPNWKFWKPWIKWLSVLLFIMSFVMAIMPSKNTVKVFMGVKAVQAVATYVDDTDIPERTKATVTKLWDKVDGYITSIDVESKADSTGTVIKSGVQSVADSTAKDIAKEVVNTVKN